MIAGTAVSVLLKMGWSTLYELLRLVHNRQQVTHLSVMPLSKCQQAMADKDICYITVTVFMLAPSLGSIWPRAAMPLSMDI